MKVEINPQRISFLLAMYNMTMENLLARLNEGRARLYVESDLLGVQMELSLLKQIDKVFKCGLEFYYDFTPIKQTSATSVFFRKNQFGTELNIESKRVVQRFETLKAQLDSYLKLSRVHLSFVFPRFQLSDNSNNAAIQARSFFYPEGHFSKDRDFLKALINKCAEQNIYVFEFVETWNKKEIANIDGLFIGPNLIVLKRQKSYKREIFTLAHELGHCLLGQEEVESVDMAIMAQQNVLSDVEKWCNDFAFSFLIGNEKDRFDSIVFADASNDYQHDLIDQLSSITHVSRLALFTRLLMSGKISVINYQLVKQELDDRFRQMIEEKKLNASDGGSVPKPILSNLYMDTMRYALYNGIVNEAIFCSRLNIKPSEIYNYI